MIKSMIADIIHDFDSHLDNGHVWMVELELEWMDEHSDPPNGWFNVHTYVVAPNRDLAQYITTTLYPDALSFVIDDKPVTREGYATRRDRS